MLAWIVANKKLINILSVVIGTALTIAYMLYQGAKIDSLKAELKICEQKATSLQKALKNKNNELEILGENCLEKQNISTQINEVKAKIINSDNKVTKSYEVGNDLKKVGEFILKGAKND